MKKGQVMSVEVAEQKADSLIAQMTIEEKIDYIGGEEIFFIKGIERLNIPSVFFTDATQGIHIVYKFEFEKLEWNLTKYAMKKSTSFPCPISLAATWNKKLAKNYSKSIGEECRAGGIAVLLGPGMNIYRQSQCGRNFEYFGEDPFLAARMIENYVEGLQSTGTVATLKHFVANNTDFFRRKSNTVVDERSLHEIYMPAFKAGIDAGAKAVMTSYNLLNGEWCGESDYVINYLLRTKLGFTGLVMTDWWSVHDGEKLVKSGQDLEMPYTIALKNAKHLLDDGKISEKDIDRMVKSIMKVCFEYGLYDRTPEKEYYETFPQHVDVALNSAREGIVLLKNNNLLPLRKEITKILVTGSFVEELLQGGGSGTVEGYDIVTMWEALKNEFGERVQFVKDPTIDQIKDAEVILCNIGTVESEGYDRPFELPEDQEAKVNLCTDNNRNTVVIVSSGSGIKMTSWNEKAGAILYSWYLGQIGNVALAEIISGKTNPSGKLPMTIEKEFTDSPAFGYMQGEDFYVGWNSEGEAAHPVYDVEYKEGIFVGYRWYESKNTEPLYHFGFGLSYTQFEIINADLSKNEMREDEIIELDVEVKNIGQVDGAEVIQLYIQDVESSLPRPLKELKGFEKIKLDSGETGRVKFVISIESLSFWSPLSKEWNAEKGKFKLLIGTSVNDIKTIKEIKLI